MRAHSHSSPTRAALLGTNPAEPTNAHSPHRHPLLPMWLLLLVAHLSHINQTKFQFASVRRRVEEKS
jgi:hypothetical protein